MIGCSVDHLPIDARRCGFMRRIVGKLLSAEADVPAVLTSVDSRQLGLKIQMLIRLCAIGFVRDSNITPLLP